jgi:hypothetical protein
MLRWLRDQGVSPRKYRLFGCACVRRLGPALEECGAEWSARLERVEQLADAAPGQPARSAYRWGHGSREGHEAAATILAHLEAEPSCEQAWGLFMTTGGLMAARARRWSIARRRTRFPVRDVDASWAAEAWRTQADLLRDLFGHLHHADPQWLVRLSRADEAVAIARGIYDEQAFAEMPVLGDALEDAGCADEEVLTHCRRRGEHARGCWVLDAILGRN